MKCLADIKENSHWNPSSERVNVNVESRRSNLSPGKSWEVVSEKRVQMQFSPYFVEGLLLVPIQ